MPLPAYQIVVLSCNSGAVLGVFDLKTFYDLRYSRTLNDIGAIAMTIPSTAFNRSIFALDNLVEVYRANQADVLTFEETYLVRLVHRYVEGDEERFVIGGLSLNHLLTRRVIDPDDDPLVAGGYSTKSGAADQVLYDYCNEQIGPGSSVGRAIPSLTLTAVSGIGLPVGQRLRHDPLFKIMQDLAKQGAVDFQILRTTGTNLELQIGVIGTDRTRGTNEPLGLPWMGLSPKRGNLTAPSLLVDRQDEQNYIYGLGQGQRDKRIVYKAAGSGVSDSPWNRIEFAEDIRNVQKSDVLALITGSEAALKDKAYKTEFLYQPTGQEPGNKYRVDWDVGDAVTVDWDETSSDLRIVKIEIMLSSDGEALTATVTNDYTFPGP